MSNIIELQLQIAQTQLRTAILGANMVAEHLLQPAVNGGSRNRKLVLERVDEVEKHLRLAVKHCADMRASFHDD